ncbi:MAG: DUF4214 domain-containing protein [Acidimicrobiales bacterium]
MLASVVVPGHASAATNGVQVGVFPEFPTRVEVGSTNVPASVNIINGSVNAEATGSLTVTDLTLVPSCGNFTPTCSAPDPGVFQLSTTGSGSAGTNCAGVPFTITVIDTATGRVRFARSDGSALILRGTDITTELDTCRINFTLAALKVPTVDSYPSLGEPQTNQVGWMTVTHPNGSTGSDQGEDVTTLVGGTTTPPPPTTTTTVPPPPTTTTTVPPTTTTAVPAVDPRFGRWVDRAYRDLLDRPPTAAESSSMVSRLVSGEWSRASAAKVITNSAEFRRAMNKRYYATYLGRPATEAELNTLAALSATWPLESCEGYVLASDEFLAKQGGTLLGFVEALYRLVLGIAPDPGGVVYLVNLLTTGSYSRQALAYVFVDSPAGHDRFVASTTLRLLDRAVTASELDQWSTSVDKELRQEDFFANLVQSNEYWLKS